MMLKVAGLFSGIGAHHAAIRKIDPCGNLFEVVAQADIDADAVTAYNLINGDTPNLGDITKLQALPKCDILFYTPPCQDISIANTERKGNSKGTGTRSALVWEVVRVLSSMPREDRPEYLVMEEVRAMVSSRYKDNFLGLVYDLQELGYNSRWAVLNSKDYGIPQNRPRLFMVSRLGAEPPQLPEPIELSRTVYDFLDKDVTQDYYLSEDRLKSLKCSNEKEKEHGNGFKFAPLGGGVAHCITTKEGQRKTSNYLDMEKCR